MKKASVADVITTLISQRSILYRIATPHGIKIFFVVISYISPFYVFYMS